MTKEEIMSYCEKLSQFDTPTISNALECFSDFKKGTGFMDYTIKSVIPCTGTLVGPAATAKIATEHPATAEEAAKMMPYYQHIRDMSPGCM